MKSDSARVEIRRLEEQQVELMYYPDPEADGYRSWKLGLRETKHLVAWWTNVGIHFQEDATPIVHQRFENILVSMFSRNMVEVRTLNEYGKPDHVGCALPRAVLSRLPDCLAGK